VAVALLSSGTYDGGKIVAASNTIVMS
jgi:hypothetical protein